MRAQDPQIRFGTQVSSDVETVYIRGLEWLTNNQTDQGNWPGSQSGHGAGDTGICGMAVMVFLASGEDPNFGRYRENIRRTLRYMIQQQQTSTGYLPGSMYQHGFAMLGLAEAYGAVDEDLMQQGQNDTQQRTIGQALELAVRCAVTAQSKNRWGGWRYTPESTDSDTSVSGAVLMGLLAARNAGIPVSDECIDRALGYFQQMTSKQGGVGYSGGVGGLGGSKNLQAISSLVMSIGRRKDLDEYQAVSRQVINNIEHNEAGYPFYFRYYMAQALFQADFDAWKNWNSKTVHRLKSMQNKDGSFQSGHGQAYGTAMSMLALALNYRLLPVYER
ncbi:MAG: squalene--hopene cyclase [Fuerstiella sp.]|nr:squalene--hopene cyclase [Fuerstiella sp.]